MEESERDKAIRLAKELYERKRQEGVNLDSGPCLSEEIIPDWCVDVAHEPRRPIDNLPQNQCRTYRIGRVHHFVELDSNGNVIRAQ